jgi:Pectate lyase superfamily protein
MSFTQWPGAYDNLVAGPDGSLRDDPSLASVLNALQQTIGLRGAFNFGNVGNAVVRLASATAGIDEITIFGSTLAHQTITLPTPTGPATNTVKNLSATQSVAVGPAVYQGVLGGYVQLNPGDSLTVSYESPTWYPVNTQQATSAPIFNVLIYGADPTGAADSTAKIQAAINACATAGGGIVYFPSGTYKITSTLTVGNATQVKTTLTGASGTTLNCPAGTGAFTASGSAAIWNTLTATASTTFTYANKDPTHFLNCSSFGGFTTSGFVVTQGTVSTQNNVVLMGPATNSMSNIGTIGWNQPSATLKYEGSAADIPMVSFVGPLAGGGVENLYFDANQLAGVCLKVLGHSSGNYENLYFANYTDKGLWTTGVTGFVSPDFATSTVGGGTVNCNFRNIGAGTFGTRTTYCMYIDGDTSDTSQSSDTFACTFENLFLSCGDPGSGNSCVGLYLKFCDENTFRNVYIVSGAGASPVGHYVPVYYDFSYHTPFSFPSGNTIDNINDSGPFEGGVWAFTGGPGTVNDPNVVMNARGGNAKPSGLTSTYAPFVEWRSDTVNGNYVSTLAALPANPAGRITLGTNQLILSTSGIIALDTDSFHIGFTEDLVTNHSLIVGTTGYYLVMGYIVLSYPGAGTGFAVIYKNNSPQPSLGAISTTAGPPNDVGSLVSDIIACTAGDFLQLGYQVNTGGTAQATYTYLSATRVS